MAGEWKQTRLGDHIALKGGLSYKSEFVNKGDALLIGMGCVSHTDRFLPQGGRRYGGDFTKAHLVEPGDLVIATRQQSDNLPILGFPAMIPKSLTGRDVIVATNLYKVANHSSISNRFLYWLLRGREYRERILECAKGTTVRMLTKDAIEDFCFLCPPAPERDAIANTLDSLDDKIEMNWLTSETLEAMPRALFKSWFVDFDPVRAKAENRDPKLPQPYADLFPDSFEDSELGEIPRGWEAGRLSDLSDIEKGLSYKGEGLADEGGLPMVNLGCFAGNGVFKTEHIKRYTGEYKERHLVEAGDVVVANTDMTQKRVILGSPAIVPEVNGERRYLFTHHTFALRFKPGARTWRTYVYFTLLQPAFREMAEGFATGTTVLALPRDGVLSYAMVLPPVSILGTFESLAGPWLTLVETHRRELQSLTALRDTLLPRLISGELRVKNTD
jgi:type I restriction enzyme, S subunit